MRACMCMCMCVCVCVCVCVPVCVCGKMKGRRGRERKEGREWGEMAMHQNNVTLELRVMSKTCTHTINTETTYTQFIVLVLCGATPLFQFERDETEVKV